jgi:glycosyltransferase involved in cell wall biosynthesis
VAGIVRVGVVTPYWGEDEWVLDRCVKSVVRQNTEHVVVQYLVGDGVDRDCVRKWECDRVVHFSLPHFGDYGNTPRCFGAALASRDGCDAICFLDADNWYEPDHVERMVSVMVETGVDVMVETGVDVVTCGRNLYRPDGTFLAVDNECDGNQFVDTNCFLIGKKAYPLMVTWLFHPPTLAVIGDRIVWNCIKQNVLAGEIMLSHSDAPTVNYTTLIASHYLRNGQEPPKNAKEIVVDQNGGTAIQLGYDEFMKLKRDNDDLHRV